MTSTAIQVNVKAPSFILMTAGLKTHANKTILHKGKKKSIKSCYINKMLKILMLWSSSCLSIKQQIMSKRSQKKINNMRLLNLYLMHLQFHQKRANAESSWGKETVAKPTEISRYPKKASRSGIFAPADASKQLEVLKQ